ncbi:MAG: ATP-binding protein [Alphaproteobacteria bacterium]|nr:ATP-binding protein [Alphaproteobacteria bacterium]
MSYSFEAVLRNDMKELAGLPPRLEAFAEEAGLPPDVAMHVDLVLDELLTNTIGYGYPDGREGRIFLHMVVDDALTITIADDGIAFDPLSVPDPDTDSDLEHRQIGGLGVYFVKTMMDEVSYHRLDGQNRLTLVKRLTTGQRDADND